MFELSILRNLGMFAVFRAEKRLSSLTLNSIVRKFLACILNDKLDRVFVKQLNLGRVNRSQW